MRNLLYILLISLSFACKSNDPHPALLTGKWQLTDLTPGRKGFVFDPAHPLFATFQANDLIEPGLFEGGYCNPAEKYSYAAKELRFAFGEMRCLPIIAPHPGVGSARIIELTEARLILDWCDQRYTFKRS